MTSTRYYMARFGQAFGYFRRNQRMADAASEMHLLREAEAQLGVAIWEKVKDIEELSVEYWNLRKFVKERDIVRLKLVECQARLDQAHEERSTLLNNTPELNQELMEKRTNMLTELEQLAHQRDEIIAIAREVRRNYEGLKMKLEVLTKETKDTSADRGEIAQVKSKLSELKAKFSDLKQQRTHIGDQIDLGDTHIAEVDGQLNLRRQNRRVDASEAFRVIGDGNKEMSVLRAESAVLDTQMRQLYAEIGRYVSRNANHDTSCAGSASTHQSLVDVMRALRRSIALNHRLAGTA